MLFFFFFLVRRLIVISCVLMRASLVSASAPLIIVRYEYVHVVFVLCGGRPACACVPACNFSQTRSSFVVQLVPGTGTNGALFSSTLTTMTIRYSTDTERSIVACTEHHPVANDYRRDTQCYLLPRRRENTPLEQFIS